MPPVLLPDPVDLGQTQTSSINRIFRSEDGLKEVLQCPFTDSRSRWLDDGTESPARPRRLTSHSPNPCPLTAPCRHPPAVSR